jgi:hypothetical protein
MTTAPTTARVARTARISALSSVARIRLERLEPRLLVRIHHLRHLIASQADVLVQLRARIAECVASRHDRRDLLGCGRRRRCRRCAGIVRVGKPKRLRLQRVDRDE